MQKPQIVHLTPSLKAALPQLSKDLRAAFSYVSFYSIESPFVIQAVKKLHQEISRLLAKRSPLLFFRNGTTVQINGTELPESEAFANILAQHDCPGILFLKETNYSTLVALLRKAASPSEKSEDLKNEMLTNELMHAILWAEEGTYDVSTAVTPDEKEPEEITASAPSSYVNVSSSEPLPPFPVSVIPFASKMAEPVQADRLTMNGIQIELAVRDRTELLLGLLAEAWQYSQLLKRHKTAHPETDALDRAFDRLFNRMLAKLEAVSPEFSSIHDWFTTPDGETLEEKVAESMLPLLEIAVKNGWTSVMCDPSTEGLVVDSLTTWGATGKHELVERAVTGLSESLLRPTEKRLALSHLRDPRPWIGNAGLLYTVLRRLVQTIANEGEPAVYQTALLLAWDLLEPAMESLKNDPEPVLALLSTLQLHAEDETPPFKERPQIARHWLYERSNPEMMRRLVTLAREAGQLKKFSILGMAAAPLLVKDFYEKTGEDKLKHLELLKDIREAVQTVLIELLPETQNENEVRYLLPVIRACGLDPSLSMQLASWVAKGTRPLKLSIIGIMEELGEASGGPALRLGVLDDDESVAEAAIRALAKIKFTAAAPLIAKAASMRRKQNPDHERFFIAACEVLGSWGFVESIPTLLDFARKKPLLALGSYGPSLPVRMAAIHALGNYDSPEVWQFMEQLSQEKIPELQELLNELVLRRTSEM